jgi:HK97 family phage major capsid protein
MKRFSGGGMQIKSTPTGKYVEGYLVRFTNVNSRDLEDEYFTKSTNFMRNAGFPVKGAPLMYDHGMSDDAGSIGIGLLDFADEDEVGMFVRAKLYERQDYEKMIEEIVSRKSLKLSPAIIKRKAALAEQAVMKSLTEVAHNFSMGSYPPTFKVAEDGHITQCGIVEGSLTVMPAEPNGTEVTNPYSKSIQDAFTLSDVMPNEANVPGRVRGEPNISEHNRINEGVKTMDMQALREALASVLSMLDQGMMAEMGEDKMPPEELEEEMSKAAEGMLEEDEEAKKQMDEDEKLPEEEKSGKSLYVKWVEGNLEELMTRTIINIENRRNGVNAAARKALAGHTPQSKRERAGAYREGAGDGDERQGGRSSGSKSFKYVNISSGFARRVDATPLLMHIKSRIPDYWDNDDCRKYRTAYREETKEYNKRGSAFIGSDLDYLGTPAIRESLIQLLVEKTFLDKVGARFYTVDGNQTVERPRLTSVPEGEWLGEGNAFTDQKNNAQMLLATPKPVGIRYPLSLALLERMRPEDESQLQEESMKALARALNRAALRGTGNVTTSGGSGASTSTGAEPLGLLNALPSAQVTNVSTNGRAPTPADMKAMKAAVEARNVELGDSTHWVYHSNVLNYFEDVTDTTGQLLNRSQWTKGFEPVTSNLVLTNLTAGTGTNLTRMYFGDWSFFEVVQNSGIQMVVLQGDTYMGKLQRAIQLWTYADFLIHQTAAFEIKSAVKV